jgi:hypothetical protein
MAITKVNSLGVSLTSPVTFPAGTVSLPSITTSGDLNTGTFFPAADTIAFTEGGAEAMRIDSSGNLLIGTTVTTGSQDNGKVIAGGVFRTVSGSVPVITVGTPVTLFTTPNNLGAFLVTINVDAGSVIYSATSIINVQESSLIATQIYKGANVAITVSGRTVRGTQSGGDAGVIQFSALRIFQT